MSRGQGKEGEKYERCAFGTGCLRVGESDEWAMKYLSHSSSKKKINGIQIRKTLSIQNKQAKIPNEPISQKEDQGFIL